MSNTTAPTAEDFSAQQEPERHYRRHRCGGSGKRRWSGLEIAAMVGGFIVFWPVGLVALGVKLVKGEMWPGASEGATPWAAWKGGSAWKGGQGFGDFKAQWGTPASSGNAAFDAYRQETLERLEAERRKLAEEQQAFADHLAKLRRAKDQEEFDRFMAERTAEKNSGPAA